MPEPTAIELKAHLPAKDFEVSKQFYQDIGFTLCWSNGGKPPIRGADSRGAASPGSQAL